MNGNLRTDMPEGADVLCNEQTRMRIGFFLSLFTCVALPAGPAAAASLTMAQGCPVTDSATYRAQDEEWVRGFEPREEAASLRSLTAAGSDSQQVLLAKRTIRDTCRQYHAGEISEEVADRAIEGFEDTIRNFLRDQLVNAHFLATTGEVAQIDSIRPILTQVVSGMRSFSGMGDEAFAQELRKRMVDLVSVFASQFLATCQQQTFHRDIALALDRQAEVLALGIDLTPCARRNYVAQAIGGQLYKATWRHCGHGVGDWKGETTGSEYHGVGSGFMETSETGFFVFRFDRERRLPADITTRGTMKIRCVPLMRPKPGETQYAPTAMVRRRLESRSLQSARRKCQAHLA